MPSWFSKTIRVGDVFQHRTSKIRYTVRRVERTDYILLMSDTGIVYDLPLRVADASDITETEAYDLFSGYYGLEFKKQ